ncbi:MAG TPA: FCD domain-containing protein [Solirubrobacteraceae bacterium]|nr:FCD domain-containing protein [Solirubrobacteraceae bacterium]
MSRLHENVMRVLMGDIVSRRVPVGGWLPREVDVAAQFRVSRGVARECIRGLEERGLVAVKHGRGAIVSPEARWNVLDPDVLGALLDSGRGAAILGEYLESRRILEIAAAGLAAERAREIHLTALSDAFDRMAAAAEHAIESPAAEELYHEADIAFHRALIDATGNRALGSLTEPIHRALIAARRPLARPDARLERSLPEHRRILAAVAQADPPAARDAMRDHLLTVEAYLREYAGRALAAGETDRR